MGLLLRVLARGSAGPWLGELRPYVRVRGGGVRVLDEETRSRPRSAPGVPRVGGETARHVAHRVTRRVPHRVAQHLVHPRITLLGSSVNKGNGGNPRAYLVTSP